MGNRWGNSGNNVRLYFLGGSQITADGDCSHEIKSDVERPDDPAYANAYFVNANSATAPGIVDADRNPVLTRSEVYSGVYGRASINLYAFNSNGNKGIACPSTSTKRWLACTWSA